MGDALSDIIIVVIGILLIAVGAVIGEYGVKEKTYNTLCKEVQWSTPACVTELKKRIGE